VTLDQFRHSRTDADLVMQLQIPALIRTRNRLPIEILFDGRICVEGAATEGPVRAVPPLRCMGGPGVYLPLKGRRPPRGEGSEVPVLEGACLGLVRGENSFVPRRSERPGRNPGKGVSSLAGGGPDALAIHSSGLELMPALAGPIGYRSTAGWA
jgi:hypothetical protein